MSIFSSALRLRWKRPIHSLQYTRWKNQLVTSNRTTIATSPVIASSFSPEVASDSISVLAITQVTIEASRPSIAPHSTGLRSPRRAPTNDAVIAARMSTASRPSRNTRIAELVTTVALLELSPSVAAASSSFVSSARRASRSSRTGARLAISLAKPGSPCAPYQIWPSIVSARPGSNAFSRRSGPNSKNEYASRRACSAWWYWPAPAAACMRSSVSWMRS